MKKIFIIVFNVNAQQHSFQNFVFTLFSITHLTLDRQTDIVCFDYFKVIIFWENQFVKNGSFTNFWLVGSRNCLMIHESRTLNSHSAFSKFSPKKGAVQNLKKGRTRYKWSLQHRGVRNPLPTILLTKYKVETDLGFYC